MYHDGLGNKKSWTVLSDDPVFNKLDQMKIVLEKKLASPRNKRHKTIVSVPLVKIAASQHSEWPISFE